MKQLVKKEKLEQTCVELMNPYNRIYALLSQNEKQIYLLSHKIDKIYNDETNRTGQTNGYPDAESLWSWTSMTAIGGIYGTHKTKEKCVAEALKNNGQIYEFENQFSFFRWAASVINHYE